MRTSGTFQEIYAAAKSHYEELTDTRPIKPVVRREGEIWMIDSSLFDSNDDINFEITLEAFDTYFYDGYKSDFVPTESDMNLFIKHMEEIKK